MKNVIKNLKSGEVVDFIVAVAIIAGFILVTGLVFSILIGDVL